MDYQKFLLYGLGLIFLAFALGSLPRTQSGGSLLFNSYWLLYILYFVPVILLAALVVLLAVIAYNWRALSEGLGHGMARRRKMRPRSKKSIMVQVFFWVLAIVILITHQSASAAANTNSTLVTDIKGAANNDAFPTGLRLATQSLNFIGGFVESSWFTLVFAGFLIVGAVVLLQSYRISLQEPSIVTAVILEHRTESLHAVREAMKFMDESQLDPRSRIITCYEKLVDTAAKLGAVVSSDQTARELEHGIRSMFMLKGDAIHELTNLFEIARYSLHDITENDVSKAVEYLEAVNHELTTAIQTEL